MNSYQIDYRNICPVPKLKLRFELSADIFNRRKLFPLSIGFFTGIGYFTGKL